MVFCNAISSKMKHRTKVIKIADRSIAGWDIVEEYKVDPFESDFDDGQKIGRVENRALSNLDANKVNNSTFINFMSRSLDYRFRSDTKQQSGNWNKCRDNPIFKALPQF